MADEIRQPGTRKASADTAMNGDKIVFRCPKGHRIVAKAETAGQRGRCSKCGAPVQIPAAVDAAVPPLPAAAPQGEATAGTEAMLPLAGETPAAIEHAAEPEDSGPVGQDGSDAGETPDLFAGIAMDIDGHGAGFVPTDSATAPVAMPAGPAPLADEGNPNATLVARLFEQMDHGGVVEIHITGGSVILPEFYDPRWSTGALGLFASRAADGTVTLTAVAWDAIQKIVVRKVEGLPDGMFE